VSFDTVSEDETTEALQPVSDGGSGGGVAVGNGEENEPDPTEMPFLDHLEEFRWALLKSIFAVLIAMIISWFLSDRFYGTITRLAENAELPLISTKLMEPIMLKLQMALVMGIVIAIPFVFYSLWSFVSPGLYKREKKWILPLVFGATLCFFIGASIAYFVIIPFILPFIVGFMPPNVNPMFTIGDFVSKILRFTLLFGIVFEMPLVAYVLAKIGILKHTWMSRYRKYAIVLIFVIGAILTPPDPVSQIMMALPLILLYEVSIVVARIGGRSTLI
ncbi:MAG: twin-arginine translocase subunit TatC, partial [Candidatus Latescibacteria bacterium]|nr:twin-arginine translocase subunit TatC [Candidatus Latescibacterota bacterium]